MVMARRGRSVPAGLAILCGVVVLGWLPAPLAAQARRGAPPDEAAAVGAASPAELQRLFDAYVAVQAQDVLQLTDAQYPQFLTRWRVLQDVRRRAQAERARIIADLRRLSDRGRAEATARDQIADRLRALRELESRRQSEEQRAIEQIDEVLEPVQQARLRVLEEQMERRKLELLVRARQSARARRAR